MADQELNLSEKRPKLNFNETLMYGHYTTNKLRNFAASLSLKKPPTDDEEDGGSKFKRILSRLCHPTTQDLIFLTSLGLIVAIMSFLIDVFCDACLEAHRWLYRATSVSVMAQYLVWVTFPIIMVCFSTGFVHFLGPTAFGSGIPEVKTILTGVSLKEYLNFSTLVSKVVGLTFSLGSGLPLGKLGPFVHVGSATARVLSKFFPSMSKMESFYSHVLTAGAAVGVSCIFSTPIGGIMYSIEATATNYATKNFWRGLYAAMCGAISFRLMTSWARSEQTILPFFKSDLKQAVPYDELEILIFIGLGLVCGLLGALFVYSHQSVVLFIRKRKRLSALLQRTRFLYPAVVTLVIFTVLFPAGSGKYMAGHLCLREAVFQMFDNKTWMSAEAHDETEWRYLSVWKGPNDNAILTVFLFFIMRFWMCAVATTLPVPCGIFIPAFALGAAFGRLSGEVMAYYFPEGIRGNLISPGAYSIIGAAAFSGAMSHTVSPSVIAFEMTGYLGHILPCVISVCVAGAVANFLRPSVYDAIIKIKNLPFLPPVINPQETNAFEVTAEDMMVKDIDKVYLSDTLEHLLDMVCSKNKERYPVLKDRNEPLFMGTITTKDLKRLIIEEAREVDNGELLHEPPRTRKRSSVANLISKKMSDRGTSRNATTPEENNNKLNIKPEETNNRPIEQHETKIRRYSMSRMVDQEDNITEDDAMHLRIRRPSRFFISKVDDDQLNRIKHLKFKKDENNNEHWSKKRLNQVELKHYVDFTALHIASKLNLFKIHWIFSYLSIHQVYVTDKGVCVGVLGLSEVLKAISNPIDPKPYFRKELEELLMIH